ncbi:hypothetical protein ISS04_01060 [Candidatus Woesearchaeota archaeon]|nr:hypothetical protein [Candidatus Woesearchaeota archaeon]
MEPKETYYSKVNIPLRLSYDSVDNFRLATKDPNEIHDPKKYNPPITLGFQLESLIAEHANNHISLMYPKHQLNKITTKFKSPLFADTPFNLELLIDHKNIKAKLYNESQIFAISDLNYTSMNPIRYNDSSEKSIKLKKKDISKFYKGMGVEPNSKFPIMMLPSISSSLVAEHITQNRENYSGIPIYLKHQIEFTCPVEEFKANKKLNLNLDSHKANKMVHIFNISGSYKQHNLYNAKLLVSFLSEENFNEIMGKTKL